MVKIGIIKVHSCIDVITNSSSELFCVVKGDEEAIRNILNDILEQFGCEAVEFEVNEMEDSENDYEIIQGQYSISYDYEMCKPPCNTILNKIKETLNIIEWHD